MVDFKWQGVPTSIDELRKKLSGDPLGVGGDPEMWSAAIESAYKSYRSATSDPDATLRFTEARDEWLKMLDAFAKFDGISAFMRYYQITDWLYAERKRMPLRQDDESAVTERLLGLLQHLFEPEADALEVAIESLKKRHAR